MPSLRDLARGRRFWLSTGGVAIGAVAAVGTLGFVESRAPCERTAATPDPPGRSGAAAESMPAPDPGMLARLGKSLFFDTSLSASGRMACASCHDPAHAYAAPDGAAVRMGGKDLGRAGRRAVPSLRYTLNRTPVWTHEYQSSPIERMIAVESVATGGFTWDGRFNSLHEQAAAPLLAPDEMANADARAVAARLERTPYAGDFRTVFGARAFDDPESAFRQALLAIERFELDDASFHPYTSKFDEALEGKAQLTEQEARGRRLFEDRSKGNCAACHRSARGADGSHPLFTDFTFAAPAVPRNRDIPANADPAYFDLGLCGPLRRDQAQDKRACGMFKTPTLRNVASRAAFFHNGAIHSLRDAVRFYVTRDREGPRWYARTDGVYDDLPAALQRNADHVDAPFNRPRSAAPALTDSEIDDVVAFLGTLTDADVKHAAERP